MSSLSPATSFAFIIFLGVLAGIGVSAMHVLPWAILPDAIEHGELLNGERQEGMFYSQIILAQKVASSIAVPLVLLVLQGTRLRGQQRNPARARHRRNSICLRPGAGRSPSASASCLHSCIHWAGRSTMRSPASLSERRKAKRGDFE